jgi:hypothetical protein
MNIELIKKFNYIYFSREYDTAHIRPYNLFLFFPRIWAKTVYYIFLNVFNIRRMKNPAGRLVFYCRSNIDYQAFREVYYALGVPKLLVMEKKFRKFQSDETLFPLSISLLLSFFLTPLFIVDYFRYYRRPEHISYVSFLRGIEDIYMTYGRYALMRFLFRFSRPGGVVISNDHCYDTVIMIHLANRYNLPSIYIQHASVGDFFPRLTVSLALLEGEDAKDVYVKRGSDADRIRLIGMVKFDPHFSQINKRTDVRAIGIALNGLEDMSIFHEDVIKIARHDKNVKIVMRPHPILYTGRYRKCYQDFLTRLGSLENLEFSDSRMEDPWAFLKKIDMQIAGDSSIHLEAILMNVVSVYYSNNSYYHSLDFYRFNRNGLIPFFKSVQEILVYFEAIRNIRPVVRNKARYYCDNVNTPMDGKSLSLALYYLEDHLKSYPRIPQPLNS